jgi:uncharacterized protein
MNIRNAMLAAACLALSGAYALPAIAGPFEDANAAERRDDYAIAIPLYRSLAEKGNVAAIKRLAFFYEIGVGFQRDWLEAAKWYSKATELDDQDAASSLGFIARNWQTMTRGPMDSTIYELVEKAAKKGYPAAQFSLGILNYPITMGTWIYGAGKENLREALIWYRRAAEQGDPDSEVALGIAYAEGLGVPQDFVEAHKWYNLGASRSTKYEDIRASINERRDALALKMTTEQVAEAQKLARDWKPKSER